MLACIRDVGGGKLRIHTYRTGRRGHLATESRKRHFDPPPLAGATSRENFRTKTAVANPVEPDQRREPTGLSQVLLNACLADGRLPHYHRPILARARPLVSVWESVSLIQSKSPCPLSIPIHAGREDPHLHLHRPRHTIAQRGCVAQGPGLEGHSSTAAPQEQKQKHACTQVSFPLPCPALQKSNTTQLNKQLPTTTHGKTGAHRYTHPRTTHTRAQQQQQHNRPAATTTRDHHPRRSAWAPGHRGRSNGKPFSFLPGPTPLPPRSQGCFLALS